MKKYDEEVASRYTPIRILFVGVETSDDVVLLLLETWLENRSYTYSVFHTTFNLSPSKTFLPGRDKDFVLIFGDNVSEDTVVSYRPDIIFNFGGTNYNRKKNVTESSTSSVVNEVTEEGMLHYNVIDISEEVTAIEKEEKSANEFLKKHDEISYADATSLIDINSRKNYLSIDEKFYIVVRTLGRFLYL